MKEKMTVENFIVGFQWSLALHKGKELSQKLLQVSYCKNLVAELSGLGATTATSYPSRNCLLQTVLVLNT